MNGRQLKDKTKAGGVVYGTMLTTSRNPRWGPRIAEFGLDFVVVDTEHSPFSRSDVADLLVVLNYTGVVTIVRVPIPSSHYVTMALDAGAQGILAPYCETVEEVKEVVAAAKWHPLKGALATRVMETGQLPSEATRKYLENLNINNVCIIGIESVPAMENLDAILKVQGIDAIFVGPNDLSISLGVPNQYSHPSYEAALRQILSKCKAAGIPVLIHHQTVELTKKWLKEGARFVLYSSDARTMHSGLVGEFASIRKVGEEQGELRSKSSPKSSEVV